MKLYMNAMSPNVRRVRLTAAVLGIALDEKQIDFTKGEHKHPDYLVLNPNGAVPTLVEGVSSGDVRMSVPASASPSG